ncbi:peptidylprolyl isomerase [Salinibacterium sp. CAN_S4]|uniref:FKBP-type peptidyl-prolyl cis-trans isomerase n=1 Tax=Salinibacterium sp. CAN_S4 TaxID=2787727 RepID=UPI001A1898BE
MRIATTMLVTAGLVVTLAACTPTSGDGAAADCTPTPSGSISDAVKATGDIGTLPIVVFDSPTAAKETERTVAIEGDGDVAQQGDTVNVQYSIFNGATGVNIAGTDYTEATLSAFPLNENLLPGFVKTLECSAVGSRVVGVIPPVDAFGEAGSADLGIEPGQDVVFVADIVSIEAAAPSGEPVDPPLPKADGVDQLATPGFPTVVLADDGRPTVTIPDEAPPAELKIAVLKKGDGPEVPAASDVIVHYEGINWNTKEIFDESWARGEPSPFNTAQVIAGFTKAIEGQTVGSQVIVIIPPSEGYGEAGRAPSIGGTDTLVFVVDILGLG